MTSVHRRLPCMVLAAAVVMGGGLSGCSADGSAADALCSDFRYDAEASLAENEERMRAIVEEAGAEPFGRAVSEANEQCSDVVGDYVAAADEAAGSPGTGSKDLEDPEVAEALAARGIDAGAVARLGLIHTSLGVEASEADPASVGDSQRLALRDAERCDAVEAGELTWIELTNQLVEDGARTRAAEDFVSYLRNAFCERLQ